LVYCTYAFLLDIHKKCHILLIGIEIAYNETENAGTRETQYHSQGRRNPQVHH
jgi:hypothetical protein